MTTAPEPSAPTYAFGDSEPAIQRLELLAELFAPSTDALLTRWALSRPAVAADLGCGPGATTDAVARHCRPGALVAVDASPAMVAATRSRVGHHHPPIEAVVADVTAEPLPGGPFDLVHARYLLAHLRDPRRVLDRWCRQLRPGGRLLVDEVDHIDTRLGTFARYLETVTALLAAEGTDLYVGRALVDRRPAGVAVVGTEAVVLPQPTAAMARLFALNLAVWRPAARARGLLADAELDALAAALDDLAASGDRATDAIVWTHRQVAYERPGHPRPDAGPPPAPGA